MRKAKIKFVCPTCGNSRLQDRQRAEVVSYLTSVHGTDIDYKPVSDKDIDWARAEYIMTECAGCKREFDMDQEELIAWLGENGMLEWEEEKV